MYLNLASAEQTLMHLLHSRIIKKELKFISLEKYLDDFTQDDLEKKFEVS